MTILPPPSPTAGTDCAKLILNCSADVSGQPKAIPVVSAVLPGMSRSEMDAHIEDCRYLAQLARARFRGSHAAKDALEAQRWQDAMDSAIRARQEIVAGDELTLHGVWTDEVLNRTATHFDVPARAVRRRMLG